MEKNIVYNNDCIGGMKDKIEDKSVDLIITDPPFAINFKGAQKNYNRDQDKVIQEYNEVKENDYYDFKYNWLSESKRCLKDTGSMYICSGWNYVDIITRVIRELGLYNTNHIIWKYNFGLNCTKRFISSHYHLLYVCKQDTKRTFNTYSRYGKNEKIDGTNKNARYADMEDVWTINKENWSGKITTANKLPGDLIKKILDYSSKIGDTILDPFAGSGQVLWFGKERGLDYIGFEKSEQAFKFINYRLNNNLYLVDKSEWDKVFN